MGNTGNRGDILETPTVTKWFDDEGIFHIVFAAGITLTVDQLKRDEEASDEQFGLVRAPVLVDARGLIHADRAARDFGAKRRSENVTAVAVLVESTLSRVIGNFFYQVNRPAYPCRLFNSEAEALTWLRTFL